MTETRRLPMNRYHFDNATSLILAGKSPAAYRAAYNIICMLCHTSLLHGPNPMVKIADVITEELARHGINLPESDVTFEQYLSASKED